MLARGTAAKILTRYKNGCALVARVVEYKIRLLIPVVIKTPVVEQKFAKAGFLDSLEELLGNDLIGIDIDPIERGHQSAMYSKSFHWDSICLKLTTRQRLMEDRPFIDAQNQAPEMGF